MSKCVHGLVAHCMDYIALEGESGVSINKLFGTIDKSNDLNLRTYLWQRLIRQQALYFTCINNNSIITKNEKLVLRNTDIESPTEISPLPITSTSSKKRKRPGNNIVSQSISTISESLSMPVLMTMTLKNAIEMQIHVIACKELRYRALNISLRAISIEINHDQLRLLECIGQTRENGITIQQVQKILNKERQNKGVKITEKVLHNALDTLLSYKLVVKRMLIVSKPTLRRLNIIHLPRFASLFHPSMHSSSAEFETDEQSKFILSQLVIKHLQQLPTQSSVITDLGRDLKLSKRRVETLRTYIQQESKKNADYPLELFQAVIQSPNNDRVEPRILNCIRYKTNETTESSNSNLVQPNDSRESDFQGSGHCSKQGILMELGLTQQVYEAIRSTGKAGATIVDLRKKLTLPGNKLPYRVVTQVAKQYELQAQPIILGKNKAFRFFVPATSITSHKLGSTVRQAPKIPHKLNVVLHPATNECAEDAHSVQNFSLKDLPKKCHVEGTVSRRRKHILHRLSTEKIISVPSLRASIHALEKETAMEETNRQEHHAKKNISNEMQVGVVDFRSILRIASELEKNGDLRLLQLPLIPRNVSTKFRALQCVVLPGCETDETLLRHFVSNYIRDERLRRIRQSPNLFTHFQVHSYNESFPIINNTSISVKRTLTNLSKGPDQPISLTYLGVPKKQNEMRHMICTSQYRQLGYAFGVMFRCKVFHRYLWQHLHDTKLPNVLQHAENSLQHSNDDTDPSFPTMIFSRDQVLHSMPVSCYIQVFAGGDVLHAKDELPAVQAAVNNKETFDILEKSVKEKIWKRETSRTAKVLGTLSDLKLISTHKIGKKELFQILKRGYADNRDETLSQALKDNALGGLFQCHDTVRIHLSNNTHGANFMSHLRIVGATEKVYSFQNNLPLEFNFKTVDDVDRYWEALEALCLERLVMENPTPNCSSVDPRVCEVPKPRKTRVINMCKLVGWVSQTTRIRNRSQLVKTSTIKTKVNSGVPYKKARLSGIVSKNIRRRKSNKKVVSGKTTEKRIKRRGKIEHNIDEIASWNSQSEEKLLQLYLKSNQERWNVAIPQGLQRPGEAVAFRNPKVFRTSIGLVTIARHLKKRKIDVKQQLKEKLLDPQIKWTCTRVKNEAIFLNNPQGKFHEEEAICLSTRLTALYRRAIMMVVTPTDLYHPLVAEELIRFWASDEIRCVWRYLWLKNWIVKGVDKDRIRGYCPSQRFQDLLKVTSLNYPLRCFRDASSYAEGLCVEDDEVIEFPVNAKSGQCAWFLSQLVHPNSPLSLMLVYSAPEEPIASTDQINPKSQPATSLFNYKGFRNGCGFAAHLDQLTEFQKPSYLLDCWNVEIHTSSTSDFSSLLQHTNSFGWDDYEAFSLVNYKDLEEYPMEATEKNQLNQELLNQIVDIVNNQGVNGIQLDKVFQVLEKVDMKISSLRPYIQYLISQNMLLCVNGYEHQLLLSKSYEEQWYLRPYTVVTVPSNQLSSTKVSDPPLKRVLFEVDKQTLLFPWLKMDGQINYPFLIALQRKVISCILSSPGISEPKIYLHLGKFLTLQDVREILRRLIDEGLIYARAVRKQKKRLGLFSTRKGMPRIRKVVGNILRVDRSKMKVLYFPHVECIQQFGSIVEDYHNELPDATNSVIHENIM